MGVGQVDKSKVGIVIQARMGSERLPGKVMLKLPYNSEFTVLEQIVSRCRSVRNSEVCAVATTSSSEDDVLFNYLGGKNIPTYRGNEHNVLERYLDAAKLFELDHVLRVTGDNPCIDPGVLEMTIEQHLLKKVDYTYTSGLPIGMNAEIISFEALSIAHQMADQDYELEHVTPFLKNNPDNFEHHNLIIDEFMSIANLRLTVDTKADYALMCLLYEDLLSDKKFFGLMDLKDYFQSREWIAMINSSVRQRAS